MSHALRVAVLASAAFLATPALAEPLLTVTGHGTAMAAATDARINGTADSKGATLAEAIANSRGTTAAIIKALAGLGILEQDFAITGMNINPQYGSGPILPGQSRPITGYNCNVNIVVLVEHPERLSDILQALAEAGVTQSERVSYVAHDSEAAQAQARDVAVKDAFARAKVLAAQTGVTLGPVVSVTDSPVLSGLANYSEQILAIAGGTQGFNRTVTGTVTVSWAIK